MERFEFDSNSLGALFLATLRSAAAAGGRRPPGRARNPSAAIN